MMILSCVGVVSTGFSAWTLPDNSIYDSMNYESNNVQDITDHLTITVFRTPNYTDEGLDINGVVQTSGTLYATIYITPFYNEEDLALFSDSSINWTIECSILVDKTRLASGTSLTISDSNIGSATHNGKSVTSSIISRTAATENTPYSIKFKANCFAANDYVTSSGFSYNSISFNFSFQTWDTTSWENMIDGGLTIKATLRGETA